MIIRLEKTIIKLIFGFFPDVYIYDIIFEIDNKTADINMIIIVLTDKDRKIAIGAKCSYIKAVNEVFDNYIFLVKIKCEVGELLS
ncbi:MAG: hypothetical protein ACFFAQ_12150 [Promethearchaeota archaeon]